MENIKYNVKFKDLIREKPNNLSFRIRGMSQKYLSLKDLEKMLCGVIEGKSEKEIIIDWEWPYETGNTVRQVARNDKFDTTQGERLESYKFEIIVIGEEVI